MIIRTNYTSFAAKQGVLDINGGSWGCTGFGSPCTQDVSGNNYGPIIGTGAAGNDNDEMSFEADIDLASTEFAGATSMSYTIKWHAVATFHGGNPSTISTWTRVGQISKFPDSISNTAGGTSITHNGVLGARLGLIILQIDAIISNYDGAGVTLAFDGLSFEIYDVVYGATLTTVASPHSSGAGSLVSSISSTNSALTSATNGTILLSSSTSFTTTISGQATIIQTIPPSASRSQSRLPSPSSSSSSTSMTAAELAGTIAGSLVGVALTLLALTFWWQWRRRKRVIYLKESASDDEQGEIFSGANREPWVPYPYRKQPYSRPSTLIVRAIPEEHEENETGEVDLVRPSQPRRQRSRGRGGNESSINALSTLPPAYSQLSPRPTSIASPSLASTDED